MVATLFSRIAEIDTAIFLLCNKTLTHPALDWFFVLITNGRTWVVPAIIAVVVFFVRQKKAAIVPLLLMVVTVGLSDPIGYHVLKPLFHRVRPCNPSELVEGGRFLLGLKTSLSFPSQHSMNMFAQAALLSWLYPRFWARFFCFAALIGYSRIYVGVHYPLDVLGGAILGALCGTVVYIVFITVKKRISVKQIPGAAESMTPSKDNPHE